MGLYKGVKKGVCVLGGARVCVLFVWWGEDVCVMCLS